MRALVAAAAESDADAAKLYEAFTLPRRDKIVARLQSAVQHGELTASADLRLVVESLIGVLIFHVLTPAEALAPERTDALVSTIINGLRASASPLE
jgi:hypothetical protein